MALKDGKVNEMGTHEELMKRRGLYYDLVESQLAGKEDTEEADETVEDLPEEVSKINRPMSRKLSRQERNSVLSRVRSISEQISFRVRI